MQIIRRGGNEGEFGTYMGRRGILYGWVKIERTLETKYFGLNRIQAVVEAPIVAAPPVARVICSNQESPRQDQERPQSKVTLNSVLNELEMLKALLVKVENDIRALSLDED